MLNQSNNLISQTLYLVYKKYVFYFKANSFSKISSPKSQTTTRDKIANLHNTANPVVHISQKAHLF
jgi:hypothetical protein